MTDNLSQFPAIIDLTGYNERTRKTFLDKTFFLEKIDATVYVDFGCGSGEMIEFMHKLFPEYSFLGYDTNPDMIDLAKNRKIPKAKFYSDFKTLISDLTEYKEQKRCLILSSVLHEVLHYGEGWYNNINPHAYLFDYIAIRDMQFGENVERPLELSDFKKIASYYFKHPEVSFVLTDFMEEYKMETVEDMYHFFLKYTYLDNWKRECAENYFPKDLKTHIKNLVDSRRFKILYKNEFYLPHIKNMVKRDFDIDMNINTHIKLILEKVN